MRQHRKLSRLQQNRLAGTIERQPTEAGDDSKTEKAVAAGKLERPIPACIDSAGLVAARFEQRKHVRKRIFHDSGRSRYKCIFHRIDSIADLP